MQNNLIFHPCKHTKKDGLHYSPASVQITGRWTLRKDDGKEYTIKCCTECNKED